MRESQQFKPRENRGFGNPVHNLKWYITENIPLMFSVLHKCSENKEEEKMLK